MGSAGGARAPGSVMARGDHVIGAPWQASRRRSLRLWYEPARRVAAGPLAAILLLALCGAASAQDATHGALTTIDLAKCTRVSNSGVDGSVWKCAGLPGYPVHLAEVDDRTFLSVGPNAEQRKASRQTLGAANTLFPTASKRATIEWRVPVAAPASEAQAKAPYATIVRYATARGTKRGQVLVVSKVTPSETCQVAFIDADANADAAALARRIADTAARTFDCAKAPKVHGLAGKSPL